MKVSVVVPFLNEQELVPKFFDELDRALAGADFEFESIAVDDGSTDATFDRLTEQAAARPWIRVVRFSRNFGHQNALLAGMEFSTGDVVVTIDGDLQDPPSVIRKLVDKAREGFDVVHAVRKSRQGEPWWRLFLIRLFYRLLRAVSRVNVLLDSGDFRLMSRRSVAQLLSVRDANPYLRGSAAWIGFRQAIVEYDRLPRAGGESKYGVFKLMHLAWNGVSSLSHVPLRLATGTGMVVSLASFLLAGWLVVQKVRLGVDPQGWTSLMVVFLFLSGLQMILIGFLGEYLGRIHDQVKQRPLYIIQDKVNLS